MSLIADVWFVISPWAPHLDIIAFLKLIDLPKTLVKGRAIIEKHKPGRLLGM
jgi:hypothetical protein